MRRVTIETRHLRIFVAVYRARSFTKAAEELFTSQPTVSEHIQNLEGHLNCRLFDRLGRSILPTAQAEMLYPRALGILEDLQRLEDELADADKSVAGQLLIGASTIPGTYILPQLAADFKRDFPKISFEIRISDSAAITSAVADNELFLGVVGAKISASKIVHQPFAEDQLILAAAAAEDLPAEIAVAELTKLPFIVRERGSGTRRSSEALLAERRLSLNQMNIVATLGSSAAVKEAIKAGLGVSMISRHAVREELQSGQLKEVRVGGLTMQRSFYVVTSSRRSLPNHYKEFLSRLLQ